MNNNGLSQVDDLGLSPAGLFGGCVWNGLKKAVLRGSMSTLRDSSICAAAARKVINSSDPESGPKCGWKTFFDDTLSTSLFDRRGFVSDTAACILSQIGSTIIDEHLKSELVKKVLKEAIGSEDISGYLARVSQQIEQGGKLRLATRCGGASQLVVIPFFETNVVDRMAGFAGQILIPLRRISCNMAGSPATAGLSQQLGMTCCGCKPVPDNDVPPYYRRSQSSDSDGFNRFPPITPYTQ